MASATLPGVLPLVLTEPPIVPVPLIMTSLGLTVDVTTSNGTHYRWGPNELPGSRPRNLTFRTKVGEGFSDGSLQLARRIDQDYPDLSLVNGVTLTGADGSVAYEGRVAEMPRELGDSHAIALTLTGWVAHLKDRTFTEIYVDRDLGAWGPASRARKIAALTGNVNLMEPEQAVDPTDSTSGVSTAITGAWASPYLPRSEAWYDAGPNLTIARVGYSWKREGTTVDNTNTNWSWVVVSSNDDKGTTTSSSAELRAAGPSANQSHTLTTPRRYALLRFSFAATPGGADGARYAVAWYKLAAYGNHGLTLRTGEPGEPQGVYVSDVIRNIIGRFCPKVHTKGVIDNGYVVQHLAYKDRISPYDALLDLNKFALWHIGVWENRTLHFRPYDLTDYDWEVRTDEPGVTLSLQGPSTEGLFNGIIVEYEDLLTGTVKVLTPDTHPADLADTNPVNPWNEHGIQHWDEIRLSSPTLAAQALQIGRAALAARNRPKHPGTIGVRGYVRDRQGNLQPGWKVRAGDTVAVTNHPNDAPRLIHETTWDDESKALTMSVEAPASALDALFDRVANARQAGGFS